MLLVLHIIAIIAVSVSAFAVLPYKTLLVFFILISLVVYSKKENNFKGLTLRHANTSGWEIAFLENQFSPIRVLPSTVITHYLIVLHYKIQNQQKRAILIFRDALINDDFRKLLVALKISGLSKDNI